MLAPLFVFFLLQISPSDALREALRLQQSGDLAAAADKFREVLKADPSLAAVHSNLGFVLSKLARYEEASTEYRIALRSDPSNAALKLNLALSLYKMGRFDPAAAQFEDLRAADPKNQQVTLLLADSWLRLGQNEKVIKLLRLVGQADASNLAVAYILGTALIRDKQVDEGQQWVNRILSNGESAEAHFLLGTQMSAAGAFPNAVTEFAKAIAINPSLPGLQSAYGQALLNTGDPDAASQAFHNELAANPADFEANLYLGEILKQRGKYAEAEAFLKRALQLRPDSVEARSALAQRLSDAPAQSGPPAGSIAPDFSLPDPKTGHPVHLAQLLGKAPIILILGSYTCPNFRAAAPALNAFYRQYGNHMPFYMVYIREAHAAGTWQSTRNEREQVALDPATNMQEKSGHAALCARKLKIDFPILIDGMDGAVESRYSAWPSRVFVIDPQGRIAYTSALTELDFRPADMAAALEKFGSPTHVR